MRLIVTLVAILYCGLSFGESIRIASWNIQHLGWGEQKSYEALGRIGNSFDIIAVQEAMTAEGLVAFREALVAESGEEWSKIYSHAIGRGSYQEKYAFVFRESRVRYVDGAVVFLDRANQFAREPYSARFEAANGGVRFVLSTVHILYGQSKADRLPEIHALTDMFDWLQTEVFPEDSNFLLLGDFNLRPGHRAWGPFQDHARVLIQSGATTLSSIDGRYANLYDNIWINHGADLDILDKGITRFPTMLGWNHEQSRRHVSDHAPVYVEIRTPGPLPERGRSGNSPIPLPESSQPNPVAGAVRGNTNSRIFHRPDCPSYEAVAPRNRREFISIAEAKAAGFREARNCP